MKKLAVCLVFFISIGYLSAKEFKLLLFNYFCSTGERVFLFALADKPTLFDRGPTIHNKVPMTQVEIESTKNNSGTNKFAVDHGEPVSGGKKDDETENGIYWAGFRHSVTGVGRYWAEYSKGYIRINGNSFNEEIVYSLDKDKESGPFKLLIDDKLNKSWKIKKIKFPKNGDGDQKLELVKNINGQKLIVSILQGSPFGNNNLSDDDRNYSEFCRSRTGVIVVESFMVDTEDSVFNTNI